MNSFLTLVLAFINFSAGMYWWGQGDTAFGAAGIAIAILLITVDSVRAVYTDNKCTQDENSQNKDH